MWVTNPTRQSLASSRKRVLRGGQRWPLRSVDSQCQGRAIEPREFYPRGPSAWTARGPRRHIVQARCVDPAGVEEHGIGVVTLDRQVVESGRTEQAVRQALGLVCHLLQKVPLCPKRSTRSSIEGSGKLASVKISYVANSAVARQRNTLQVTGSSYPPAIVRHQASA